MNKTVSAFACLCMMAGLLTGCSMNEDTTKDEMSKANKSSEKVVDDTKKAAEKAKNTAEDSIDNVMTYFTNEGVAYENMQSIEHMDFAAHEGRSFDMNGKTAYLYRVKSDDEDMKKVIKEVEENGKTKVKIDNKEMEYGAMLNGDYLLLYDTSADMADMQKAFPNYQPTGIHGSDPVKDTTTNDGTMSDETKNDTSDKTNNTTNDMNE